jgi:hypothetical protein
MIQACDLQAESLDGWGVALMASTVLEISPTTTSLTTFGANFYIGTRSEKMINGKEKPRLLASK